MTKDNIQDWDATAANNTDIGGVNIAESCAPSGLNNAVREAMAQIKASLSGADASIITGTAGSAGNLAAWNADGDVVAASSSDAAAQRSTLGAPATPTLTPGTPGDFRQIITASGAGYTLSAGGTWAWFAVALDSVALTVDTARSGAGINAGGVTILGAVSGTRYVGFTWRIS